MNGGHFTGCQPRGAPMCASFHAAGVEQNTKARLRSVARWGLELQSAPWLLLAALAVVAAMAAMQLWSAMRWGAVVQYDASVAVEFVIRDAALLERVRSPVQDVTVHMTRGFGKVLSIDGDLMLTERDHHGYHEMLAHVPLALLPGASHVRAALAWLPAAPRAAAEPAACRLRCRCSSLAGETAVCARK